MVTGFTRPREERENKEYSQKTNIGRHQKRVKSITAPPLAQRGQEC